MRTNKINIDGTLNVLCRERTESEACGVCGFVFCLWETPTPKIETCSRSRFAVWRHQVRASFTADLWAVLRLENVALRYFNIFGRGRIRVRRIRGAGQVLHGILGRYATACFGDGNRRGFYVRGQRRTSEFTGCEAPMFPEKFSMLRGDVFPSMMCSASLERITAGA